MSFHADEGYSLHLQTHSGQITITGEWGADFSVSQRQSLTAVAILISTSGRLQRSSSKNEIQFKLQAVTNTSTPHVGAGNAG